MILTSLQPKNWSSEKVFIYSVGLSIFFLVGIGLLNSFLGLLLEYKTPLSSSNAFITIYSVLLFLFLFNYRKNNPLLLDLKLRLRNPKSLLPFFLLFLSIIGAFFSYYYRLGFLTFLLYIAIAAIPILVYKKNIESRLYPIVILMIGLSLTYSQWLIAPHIIHGDISLEYYFSNMVMEKTTWFPSLFNVKFNSFLTNIMYFPLLSKISGLNLAWVYKIVYPFLLSLIPLSMYVFFKQLGKRKAFFGSLFFPFVFIFFNTKQIRQPVAQLFLMLILILVFIDSKKLTKRKFALLSFFILSMIVFSHYGTSVITLFIFASMMFISWITKSIFDTELNVGGLNWKHVIVLGLLIFSWYIYTSSGSSFSVLVRLIYSGLVKPFSFKSLTTVSYLRKYFGIFWTITKFLIGIFLLFIGIGIFSYFSTVIKSIKKKKPKIELSGFQQSFFCLSLPVSLIMIITLVLPRIFSVSGLHATRILFIIFMILPCFGILGIEITSSFFDEYITGIDNKKIIAVFCCVFFIFNSNLVAETTQRTFGEGYSVNKALMQSRIDQSDTAERVNYYSAIESKNRILALNWIGKRRSVDKILEIGTSNKLPSYVHANINPRSTKKVLSEIDNVNKIHKTKDRYLFLSGLNITDNIIVTGLSKWSSYSVPKDISCIYNSGKSKVFLK